MRRPAALLVTLALGAALLAGCSGDRDVLTVYSGRTSDLVGPLLERFAEEHDVGIDVRYGDSAELALLIEQEGEDSPADVFLSQSPGAIGYLHDHLRELPDDVLRLVPADFRDGEGRWVGLSGRVRVLVYNREMVDQADLPASIFDLVQPEYAGRVGIAPTNGSFQDFVTAMRVAVGDERARSFLEGLAENDSPTFANNNAIVDAVASGEVAMGLVNHYYNERELDESPGSPSRNHLFGDGDLGSLILTTGVGILQSADHGEEAEALIGFLLGEEAQTFFSEETYEYPLAQGVEPAVEDLPPLESIAAPRLDLSSLGGGLAATRRMIAAAGLD